MPETLRYHDGQAYLEVNLSDPLPVQVVRDLQSSIIHGTTKQVSVATTATRIVVANPKRKSIKITNVTGTQLVWLGFTGAVSATTGDYLHSSAGSNTTITAQDEIWGIAVTSAQTVSVMEEEYVL